MNKRNIGKDHTFTDESGSSEIVIKSGPGETLKLSSDTSIVLDAPLTMDVVAAPAGTYKPVIVTGTGATQLAIDADAIRIITDGPGGTDDEIYIGTWSTTASVDIDTAGSIYIASRANPLELTTSTHIGNSSVNTYLGATTTINIGNGLASLTDTTTVNLDATTINANAGTVNIGQSSDYLYLGGVTSVYIGNSYKSLTDTINIGIDGGAVAINGTNPVDISPHLTVAGNVTCTTGNVSAPAGYLTSYGPYGKIVATANQAIAQNTWTEVTNTHWGTSPVLRGGMTYSTGRFIIPETGRYLVIANLVGEECISFEAVFTVNGAQPYSVNSHGRGLSWGPSITQSAQVGTVCCSVVQLSYLDYISVWVLSYYTACDVKSVYTGSFQVLWYP